MKWYHLTGLSVAVALFCATAPVGSAKAQTQCPVGTVAGSITCAPDALVSSAPAAPSGPRVIRERLNGIAGFAINTDTSEIYLWTGYNNDVEEARFEALATCQQPNHSRSLSMSPPSAPDAPCEILSYWSNNCAALAKGAVSGNDLYFSQVGANMRAARNATLASCNEHAQDCMIVHDARCVSASNRTRAPYDWERQY